MLPSFQKVNLGIDFILLSKYIRKIFDFIEVDPYLKYSHHSDSTTNYIPIDKKIFFSIEERVLYLSVTDGYRILIYTIPVETKEKINFSLSRNDVMKILEFPNSSFIKVAYSGKFLEISSDDSQILRLPIGKGLPPLNNYFKSPVITEVKVDGEKIKQEASLFGRDEQFQLEINSENQQMILMRSITDDKHIFSCPIKGKSLIRYISPIFLYPLFLFLNDEKEILIRFHDPFIIELKDTNIPELTYFVMPIYHKQ